NSDGWPDIYFIGGGDLHGRGIPARNALYRNNGEGTFTDVTDAAGVPGTGFGLDRKSTRLNSSHRTISYAVFCLKKKKKITKMKTGNKKKRGDGRHYRVDGERILTGLVVLEHVMDAGYAVCTPLMKWYEHVMWLH